VVRWVRCGLSVAGPFGCRCLNSFTMLPFPHPAHRNNNKDQSVLSHIDELVKEEERLYGKNGLTGDDRGRLAELKVELDQCWDFIAEYLLELYSPKSYLWLFKNR
jgi:hypothetical protein